MCGRDQTIYRLKYNIQYLHGNGNGFYGFSCFICVKLILKWYAPIVASTNKSAIVSSMDTYYQFYEHYTNSEKLQYNLAREQSYVVNTNLHVLKVE